MHRTSIAGAPVAVVGLALLGLGPAGAGAQGANAPGVTPKAIKVGFIWSETGVAASAFTGAGSAFQARSTGRTPKAVNAKIETEIVDDQSSGANLTAAEDLVQNRDVFTLVNDSSFGFLTWRYLVDAGVPYIGGGFDGDLLQPARHESIVSVLGNVSAQPDLTSMISSRRV